MSFNKEDKKSKESKLIQVLLILINKYFEFKKMPYSWAIE